MRTKSCNLRSKGPSYSLNKKKLLSICVYICVCQKEKRSMEEDNHEPPNSMQYSTSRIISPEIVEISEDSRSFTNSKDRSVTDIYVAVGKDDLDVLRWVLGHAVSPGATVFLVHVFPPITPVPTPVRRLSMSQLGKDQVRSHISEENNKRRKLLQKYIRLCNNAKVTVDTMLLESNHIEKAILDLIPVVNITNLVIGARHPPQSRLFGKRSSKGEFLQKKAPDYCKVTVVHNGKKVTDGRLPATRQGHQRRLAIGCFSRKKLFECCFSGKLYE